MNDLLLRCICVSMFVAAATGAAAAAPSSAVDVSVTVVSSCAMSTQARSGSAPVAVRCSNGVAPRITIEQTRMQATAAAAQLPPQASTSAAEAGASVAIAVIEL